MPFASDPVVRCLPDGITFELVDPVAYRGTRETWHIPAGFRTDFATIPTFVSWLIAKLGAYSIAAILHDCFCVWLAQTYRTGVRPLVSARDTDAIFRRVMREAGVDLLTRWLVWTGVRWGALANPARREGWHRDAPLVLLISLLALPFVLPPSVLIGITLGLKRLLVVLLRVDSSPVTKG